MSVQEKIKEALGHLEEAKKALEDAQGAGGAESVGNDAVAAAAAAAAAEGASDAANVAAAAFKSLTEDDKGIVSKATKELKDQAGLTQATKDALIAIRDRDGLNIENKAKLGTNFSLGGSRRRRRRPRKKSRRYR